MALKKHRPANADEMRLMSSAEWSALKDEIIRDAKRRRNAAIRRATFLALATLSRACQRLISRKSRITSDNFIVNSHPKET